MKLTTRIAILGGLAGFVFTRIPYMEDGNLLITNVVVLISAAIAVISWKILNSIFKIEFYFQRKRK
ncbi:MAG: hypothetical protein ACO25L_06495 [Candidatus Nanopelagicales bacterium]